MSALAQFRITPQPLVERDKFEAQGFITVRGVMDVGLLESLLAAMDERFVVQLRRLGLPATPGGTREGFHANAQALLGSDPAAYREAVRMGASLAAADEVMQSWPIVRIMGELGFERPLIARPIEAHVLSTGLNAAGSAAARPAHQDTGAARERLTVWIPLTPVSVRSHPLEVSPRSHLLGPLPVDAAGAVDDPRVGEETFAPLPVQPGDVVVLSRLLVHRTGTRGDGSVRVAISGEFEDAAEAELAR